MKSPNRSQFFVSQNSSLKFFPFSFCTIVMKGKLIAKQKFEINNFFEFNKAGIATCSEEFSDSLKRHSKTNIIEF